MTKPLQTIETELREAVIKAVPEIAKTGCHEKYAPEHRCSYCMVFGRPIRLADILLAIGSKKIPVAVDDQGAIWDWQNGDWHGNGAIRYNLGNDDLAAQSEETKRFLHSLLI